MGGAVEAEGEEAEGADEDAVELVEGPVRPEPSVGRLVKADRRAVHEMTGDED